MTASGLAQPHSSGFPIPVSEGSRERLLDAMTIQLFRDHFTEVARVSRPTLTVGR